MNHRRGPDSAGVGQLVGHAAAALTRSTAPSDGRAVKIALAVNRDALVRFASVGASGKAVEHSVSRSIGGGCHPANRAPAKFTPPDAGTTEGAPPVALPMRVR